MSAAARRGVGNLPVRRWNRARAPLAMAFFLALACSSNPEEPRSAFIGFCIRDCVEETGDASVCDAVCPCIVHDLDRSQPPQKTAALLRSAVTGSSNAEESASLRKARESCRHRATSG